MTDVLSFHFALTGKLFPDICSEIERRIDTPLVLVLDKQVNKYYLGCNINKTGQGKYRSPYTDKSYSCIPESDNGNQGDVTDDASEENETVLESGHLKMLEVEFGDIYENYCKHYSAIHSGCVTEEVLDHGILVSNVYCYDLSGDSFGACFTMKHIVSPFKLNSSGDDAKSGACESKYIYYLDAIHNVETVISHTLGTSTYKICSVYYYGFSNKDKSVKYDGCKTNWLEKKCEFSTLKFVRNLKRTNTAGAVNPNLSNITALDRNSITVVNNQTLYFHLLNIGKLIESVDNTVMKQIRNVYIDNIINISSSLRS